MVAEKHMGRDETCRAADLWRNAIAGADAMNS